MRTRTLLSCSLLITACLVCLCGFGFTAAYAAAGDDSAAQLAPAEGVLAPQADGALGTAGATKAGKPSKAQLKRFKKASADFSLELFQRCVAAKGKGANVTIAPLSIMNALAITANGAGGKTAREMRDVLADGAGMGVVNKNLAWYNGKLVSAKRALLRNANAIWYHDDGTLKMKKKFLSTAQGTYKAAVKPADFTRPETVDAINSWVAENTNNMIKRIISNLSTDDRIVIVNALYFDAKWAAPYDKGDVGEATFTTAKGDKRTVDMMYGTEHTYLEGKNVTGFMKPYAKGYSYVALLPKEGMSLKKYVSTLNGDTFRKLIADAQSVTVHTGLPKYSLSYSNDAMEKQLQAMGIVSAFNPDANFSKMASDATGNLYIGGVMHKTKVDLDELGTKAAAATAVVAKANAAYDPDAKTVILNRPFVYAIVDNATKLPVFIGTVNTIGK